MIGGWFTMFFRGRRLKKHLQRMEEAEERALMPSDIKPKEDKPADIRGNLAAERQSFDDFMKAMGLKK